MATEGHGVSPEGSGRRLAQRAAEGVEPTDRCAIRGGAGRAWQVVGGGLYVAMTALGAATLFFACGDPLWRWVAAAAYCAYAPAAGVLFAIRGCGHSAGRSVQARRGGQAPAVDEDSTRARGFWLHLPLVLPVWLLPPVAAGVATWLRFSWLVVALAAAFAADSLVVLPLVARFYIGPHCPQKDTCPWMRGSAKAG